MGAERADALDEARSAAGAPWALEFGVKSVREVQREGVWGLLTQGMATLYDIRDATGEYQEPGGFADIVDTWGRQSHPLVDYEHGLDPVLATAAIGWGTKYELRPDGLYCECFLPREPTPAFRDNPGAKNKRWAEIYAGILAGKIRGYSVSGVYRAVGKALKKWSMNALTITSRPCLPQAQFALGTKAVKSMMDTAELTPPMYGPTRAAPVEQRAIGQLSRPAFGTVMRIAQSHNDAALHDHLLNRPAHLQGDHDAESCGICAGRRSAMGVKSEDWAEAAQGEKASLSSKERDDLPSGAFAFTDSDGTGHLPIHDAAHVRNALARFDQTDFPSDAVKSAAHAKILAAAKKFGVETSAASGEKAAVVLEAEAVIARYETMIDNLLEAGSKAGRRLSQKSRETVSHHIQTLEALKRDLASFLDEEEAETPESAEESGTESASSGAS